MTGVAGSSPVPSAGKLLKCNGFRLSTVRSLFLFLGGILATVDRSVDVPKLPPQLLRHIVGVLGHVVSQRGLDRVVAHQQAVGRAQQSPRTIRQPLGRKAVATRKGRNEKRAQRSKLRRLAEPGLESAGGTARVLLPRFGLHAVARPDFADVYPSLVGTAFPWAPEWPRNRPARRTFRRLGMLVPVGAGIAANHFWYCRNARASNQEPLSWPALMNELAGTAISCTFVVLYALFIPRVGQPGTRQHLAVPASTPDPSGS